MIAQYFFDCPTEEEITNEMPTLQILNGSGDFSKLSEVINKYKEKGYNILKVGNTESKVKHTTITNRTKQNSETVTEIKNIILEDADTETGKDTEDVDFTVTIGQDY